MPRSEYDDVMKQLEALGTAQNRKIYARHGVGSNMFGVSYANIDKLKKRLKTNQPLAEALWSSGNHDARVLATMIADPQAIKGTTLESWSKDLDCYVQADALAKVVGQTSVARTKAEKWARAKDEWLASAGWNVIGHLAMSDPSLGDDYFDNHLKTIEANIHASKNRVRFAMNTALICIGLRNDKLQRKAVTAAKRIGEVDVDHGETGCKTPNAVVYIAKASLFARRRRKG